MDDLRGLLSIRRMDRVPNARIRELCRVTKGVDEKMDEGALRCFAPLERKENEILLRGSMQGSVLVIPQLTT